MGKPLISIIVPVYNVEEYLKRCVDSILEQTYTNLEIILIDDGSTDSSGALCDRFAEEDKRICVIHKENGGLSDARNAGLDKMSGEYVTCIDSDDFVSPYYVENLYSAVCQGNSQVACSFFVDYYDNDTLPEFDVVDSRKIQALDREGFFRRMLYQDGVEISAWGKLYKSEYFVGVRFPKGKLYEDIPTTYQLIEKADTIAVIPNVDYLYYQRSDSIAHTSFSRRKMDAIIHMEALRDYMTEHYPNLEKAAKCRYFSTVCNILFLINNKEHEKERIYLWGEIKKHRSGVLLDENGRKKARYAALLSYAGYRTLKFLYFLKVKNR